MTHQHISFFKSGVRIFGYFCLAAAELAHSSFLAGCGFSCILAGEILGIIEEVVAK